MKLLSLNIGKPQPFTYHERQGFTFIFKLPVEGVREVSFLNVEGDEQGDLSVHGGALKAVYSYDISYYDHWKGILNRNDWSYGMFGENLTTEGMPDDNILIGNIYKIGSVVLRAVQPRFPCFKLNIRFEMENMLQQFMQQAKHGTYFSVVQEGSMKAGDTIELLETSKHKISIQQLVEAYNNKGADQQIVEKILAIDFLPERLRRTFVSFLR